MIVAMRLDRSIDLKLFSGYLGQSGVRHRISEDGEKQIVWVATEAEAEAVRDLYAQLESGEARIEVTERPPGERPVSPHPSLLLQMRRAPLTMALVIINIALYPATRGIDAGHFSDLLHLMTLVPFQQAAGYLYFSHLADVLASMQYWRLLTPMFLHFSIMHIAFNLTFLWVFGSRIEVVSKSVVLLAVVLITSIAANLAQYALTGPTLFGGMSGVVAGLLGYCMVWSRLVPERSMGLAPPIYIGMIALLALGAFGLFNFMTPGKIANGAHFGGLASGAALGLLFGLFARQKA